MNRICRTTKKSSKNFCLSSRPIKKSRRKERKKRETPEEIIKKLKEDNVVEMAGYMEEILAKAA